MRKKEFDFVLDCSVTMAWIFEDEMTSMTEKILDLLEKEKAIVPTIWPLEVANVLLGAIRKKKITDIQSSNFILSMIDLSIHIDETTTSRAMHSIFILAQQERLTIYDAAYLELAGRIPILRVA